MPLTERQTQIPGINLLGKGAGGKATPGVYAQESDISRVYFWDARERTHWWVPSLPFPATVTGSGARGYGAPPAGLAYSRCTKVFIQRRL